MAKFQVAIRYEGTCCEEIVEIEANSAERARQRCLEIVEENRIAIEKAEKNGIYISRSVADCRLHNVNYPTPKGIGLPASTSVAFDYS